MWMHQVVDYLFFNLKLLSVIVLFLIFLVMVISILAKGNKGGSNGNLIIKDLSEQYNRVKNKLYKDILSKKIYKNKLKSLKKTNKTKNKDEKSNIYVIKFDGDIQATQVKSLREEITAILSVATDKDEVIVCLDSPGGAVNSYGLASSQLARLKSKNIKLTIVVDSVAASGGYMMAVVADKIVSAPFAIIGSIGVVGQIPNINKFLKKNGVDIEMHTAGKYKRTLTTLGENTDEGREKFKEDLESIQVLFKNHIKNYRPSVDIDKVSTGEYWFGTDALNLNLVDSIGTSDSYLAEYYNDDKYKVSLVTYKIKKSKFSKSVSGLQKIFMRQSL